MSSFQLKALMKATVHNRQLVRHDGDPRGVGMPSLTAKTGLSDCTWLGGSAIALGALGRHSGGHLPRVPWAYWFLSEDRTCGTVQGRYGFTYI